MDKQGTISDMLELVYTIKLYGVRGAGLEATYELKNICEKMIAMHSSQKATPGYNMNGDRAPLRLIKDEHENEL